MASVGLALRLLGKGERLGNRAAADAILFEENLFPIFGEHSEGFQVEELR